MSDPSGLPNDATVAERLAAHEAERAKRQERIDFIAPAFTKINTSNPEQDLAEAMRVTFEDKDSIELTIAEVEQIARRIAELNSAVMAGSLVNAEAESRAQVAEAEAAAVVGQAQPTPPQRAPQDARTEYQRDRIAAARAARDKSPDSPL